jgi:hypothetical protein
MSEEPLGESWFEQLRPLASSLPPPPSLPPPRPAGDPAWSAAAGAIAGAAGGIVALLVTDRVGAPLRALHQLETLAYVAPLASLAGAVVGGIFGRLSRRLLRMLPRIVFAEVLALVLWLFAYAFALERFAPTIGLTIAFAPSVLGALAFGACVGATPPVRVRGERGRRA